MDIFKLIIKYRRHMTIFVHMALTVLANYLAFYIRFEAVLPQIQVDLFLKYLLMLVIIRSVLYLAMGQYKGIWKYASIRDLMGIIWSTTAGTVIFIIMVRYVFGEVSYPRSIYVLDWMVLIILAGGSRLVLRVFREYMSDTGEARRVLVIGAGDAGEMIVREMKTHPQYNYKPVGFIDEDASKKGLSIHGIKILGTLEHIDAAVNAHAPDEFLIAIPSATRMTLNRIYEALSPYSQPIKTLPGVADILDGTVTVSNIKPLSMEDLLHREPVRTDIEAIRDFISGKRVLITGAGGSIGSELARQIHGYGPSEVLLIDRYENGLFDIDMELSRAGGATSKSFIRDVTDRDALDRLFESTKPQVVFHAAAHKHVPLMEGNPLEAIKNNVFGTRNVIELSVKHKVVHFVMVSTDKAVNPTNIMGASKRIAEFLALKANEQGVTKFTTVRFGNVLGSNGSVIHIFREQLRRGGPITVTHPDITRFFMLIPEAVQLVLLAASNGRGGEIFVLDMGEPIKIMDFAKSFIKLSGLVPYEDIDIKIIGLRPGEKLYEELFDVTDRVAPSENKKFMKAIPDMPSDEALTEVIADMKRAVTEGSEELVRNTIKKIIPGFKSGSN